MLCYARMMILSRLQGFGKLKASREACAKSLGDSGANSILVLCYSYAMLCYSYARAILMVC